VTSTTQSLEWLVRLLVYIGGVASAVVGSWVSSKIHVYHENRKAHLEDIKEKVLMPLRSGLEHFKPFVFCQKAIVSVEHGPREYHEKARVSEYPTEEGPLLVAAFPGTRVFGLAEPALLQDATKNHFRNLMAKVDDFVKLWARHAGECHVWVARIANEILEKSGLAAFPNRAEGPEGTTYVMQYRLAAFLYERLFRISSSLVQQEEHESYPDENSYSTLKVGSITVARGHKDRLTSLVKELDRLLESENSTAERLRSQNGRLQEIFTEISQALDLAVASRRLRKRCDLVTFF